MGSIIVGTGICVPPNVVTNADLAKVMETDPEWIARRSGVQQRHYADVGVGSAELASNAVLAALDDAGLQPGDVDALISATMTPDHYAPGNAPLIQARAGLGPIAAFDIRQQCGGFLYGLDMADALIETGRAETVVVVGAEVHRGYLPFGDSMNILFGESDAEPSRADWDSATDSRAWSVLFGDGAGATVLQKGAADAGFLHSTLHTDGTLFDLIHVEAPGFVHDTFSSVAQIEAGMHTPQMNGAGLFRQAVKLMPEAVRTVVAKAGIEVHDLDLVLAHQANQRIIDGIANQLGLEPNVVPSNIAMYGNTTAATLPLLFHDVKTDGRVPPGTLLAFTAFGAGAHWGALLYREPGATS